METVSVWAPMGSVNLQSPQHFRTHQIVSEKEQTIHCGLFFLNLPVWSPQIATPSILNLVSEYPFLPRTSDMTAWMVRKTHTGERGGQGLCGAAGATLEVQTAEGTVVIEARECWPLWGSYFCNPTDASERGSHPGMTFPNVFGSVSSNKLRWGPWAKGRASCSTFNVRVGNSSSREDSIHSRQFAEVSSLVLPVPWIELRSSGL